MALWSTTLAAVFKTGHRWGCGKKQRALVGNHLSNDVEIA